MKKIILSLLLTLSVFGCASAEKDKYKADYQLGFKQVRLNGQVQPEEQTSGLAYKDQWIRISFDLNKQSVGFSLENLNNQALKIHWDDSVLIIKGHPERIIHSGVKYVDASKSIPASIVPGQSTLKDFVVPASSINYSPPSKYSSGSWYLDSIMPHFYTRATQAKEAEFRQVVSQFDGADLHDLMLQLEINGEKKEYYFDFHIPSAKVSEITN